MRTLPAFLYRNSSRKSLGTEMPSGTGFAILMISGSSASDDVQDPIACDAFRDGLSNSVLVCRPSAVLQQRQDDLPLLVSRGRGSGSAASSILNRQMKRRRSAPI